MSSDESYDYPDMKRDEELYRYAGWQVRTLLEGEGIDFCEVAQHDQRLRIPVRDQGTLGAWRRSRPMMFYVQTTAPKWPFARLWRRLGMR